LSTPHNTRDTKEHTVRIGMDVGDGANLQLMGKFRYLGGNECLFLYCLIWAVLDKRPSNKLCCI